MPLARRSSAPLALLLAVIVGSVGALGVIRAANARTTNVERIDGLELVLEAQDGPAVNYLLVGSDSRENADPNSPDFGGIGDESVVQGRRSDTIMILRQEEDGDGASLVSLPRDLWVEIAGKGTQNRINSAYNDGIDVLAATITENFGIPINHVVDVDFEGFKEIVDAVGGTEVCFEYATRDDNTGLEQDPGCHTLNGVESLQYTRSRYFEEFRDGDWRTDPTADLGRIERQQGFITSTANRALTAVQSDPFAAGRILDASTAAVRMDPGLDPIAAAGTLRKAFGAGLNTYQLPVTGRTVAGNAVLDLAEGSEAILDYFRGIGPRPPVES
ncbi:MAG: LCP family protein [Actinomycetota bacterium]